MNTETDRSDTQAQLDRPAYLRYAERVAVGLSVVIVIVWILTRFFGATAIASSFSGEATDGTFQLLNPLRRLAAGQHMGTDFPVFHGPLVVLAHWPLFRLVPGLWSVEFQRWLLPSVALVLSMMVGWRALLGSWGRSVVAVAVMTSLVGGTMLVFLAFPQQSVLGLRAAMPLLVAAAIGTFGLRGWRASGLAGLLLACAYLSGYEQGLATVGALGVVVGARALRLRSASARWSYVRAALAVLGVGALTSALVALLIARTVRGAAAMLAWPFTVLAPYQGTAFGSPPSPTLLSWEQLVLSPVPALLCAALASLGVFWLRSSPADSREGGSDRDLAAALLITQGVLALVSLGGAWTPEYYGAPLFRSLWLVTWYLVTSELARRSSPVLRRLGGGGLIAACVLAWPSGPGWRNEQVSTYGLLLAGGTSSPREWWSRAQPSRMGLSPKWTLHVKMADDVLAAAPPLAGSAPLWSTFTGIVEARHGWLGNDTDYLIHVLGAPALQRYVAAFRQHAPAVVQTARVTDFPFEPVMQTRWWPFYEALVERYDVAAAGPYTLLWIRRASGATDAAGTAVSRVTVTDDDSVARVSCPASPAYLVDAEYQFSPALPLPLASSLRRTVLWVSTPTRRRAVALDEREHAARVPVLGSRQNGWCRVWLQRAPFMPARRLTRLVVTFRPLNVNARTARLLFDDAAPAIVELAHTSRP